MSLKEGLIKNFIITSENAKQQKILFWQNGMDINLDKSKLKEVWKFRKTLKSVKVFIKLMHIILQ